MMSRFVRSLSSVDKDDVGDVGGKNASIGEMLSALSEAGVAVPGSSASTTAAHIEYLAINDLRVAISGHLEEITVTIIDSIGLVRRLDQPRNWYLLR